MSRLIEYFVARPRIAHFIFFVVAVCGLLSVDMLQYQVNPSLDLGLVNITTTRPQAGPEDMELSVTIPLDTELLKIDGLKRMTSRSMEGLSVITIQLDPDLADKAGTLADIQKAVDRVKAQLPDDLREDPTVDEVSTDTLPLLEVHVTGAVSEDLLRRTARRLETVLREVPGVAGVDKVGFRRKEVRIFADPSDFQRLGLRYSEVRDAIRRRNVRESGGSLSSFRTEKKILSVGQFRTPEDVGEVIVRAREPGNDVRLRDVAEIVPGFEKWQIQSRVDGAMSIALNVTKKAAADELKTVNAVRQELAETRKSLAPGVELIVVNDISRITRSLLNTLISNVSIGFVLVFIVLLVFLNLRQAVWVSLGLPFTVLLTLSVMALAGISINAITLLAMLLMIGILVDDAVVTGESIQRQLEAGHPPPEAAVRGAAIVAAPVFVSVVTTIVAFMPLVFLGGSMGEFIILLPIVVMLLLAASLFESKFLLPSHLAHGAGSKVRSPSWLLALEARFADLLAVLLRRRYLTTIAFVAVFAGVVGFGVAVLRFELSPDTEFDTFFLKVEMPEGTPFEETVAAVNELTAFVRERIPADDLLNITARIGHHDVNPINVTEGRSQAWALLTVLLEPEGERASSSLALVDALRGQVKGLPRFKSVLVVSANDGKVPGKPVELEIVGNDDVQYELAAKVEAFLKAHAAATEVWTSFRPGKDIIDLQFNHRLLAARGLTVSDVTETVAIALDGRIVGEQQTLDERVYFRLQLPPDTAGKLETLENLTIMNADGKPIYLKSVADLRVRPGDADIKHYFGKRTVTVFAEIDRRQTDVAAINAEVAAFIEAQNWKARYPDLRFVFSGELVQQKEVLGNVGIAFAICLLSIFFVLVLLFNSFSQPMLIFLDLPFSVAGVIIGFGLQGIPLSFLALVGVIGLMGVLVNDSVVMVHELNRHKGRASGPMSTDRIAEAAKLRFRPIIITSITTSAALFPAAYGLAGSNELITPMVMAMAWGVLFGTFISLLLLPCLYAINEDLSGLGQRLWERLRRGGPVPGE